MSIATSKNISMCPECGAEVRFKKPPFLGQMVTCRRCQTQLEVAQRSPIELAWAFAEDMEDYYPGQQAATRSRQKSKKRDRSASYRD